MLPRLFIPNVTSRCFLSCSSSLFVIRALSQLFLLPTFGSTLLVQSQDAQQCPIYQNKISHSREKHLRSLERHYFCARWQEGKSHSIQQPNINVGRARIPLLNICANIQSPCTLFSEFSVGGGLVLVVLEATGICMCDSYCMQWRSITSGH